MMCCVLYDVCYVWYALCCVYVLGCLFRVVRSVLFGMYCEVTVV